MNAGPDVERRISDYLAEEVPTRAPDRILPATFERSRHTRQRRFGVAWRTIIMTRTWQLATAAVVGVLLIGVGAVWLGGSQRGVGGQSVAPSTPIPTRAPAATPTVAPTASPLPLSQMKDGVAGTYVIDDQFAIPGIGFTLPSGWMLGDMRPGSVWVTIIPHPDSPDLTPGSINFSTVYEVYPDPCGAPNATSSPRVGPTVDDLVAALTTLKNFRAGPVQDVTIGGHPAKSFGLQEASDACQDNTLIGIANTLATNTHTPQQIIVLDVGGRRLAIQTSTGATSTQADRDAIDSVIASLTFE